MISFENILRLKGFPIKEARRHLAEEHALSSDERFSLIEKKKWEIAKYHAAHNPLYRKLLNGQFPAQWLALPIVNKSNLQLPIESMLSDGMNLKSVYISNTSGSSGHPFFFAKDKFCHALTWAFIANRYLQLGIRPGDWQARFYGIPLDTISYLFERAKDFAMKRVRFPVFDMGDAALEVFLKRFSRTRFIYVYGYTNSILLFSKFLLRKGISLREICPTLDICIVTSEVCTEDDKKTIQEAIGVPVVREYGASELDIIAIEDRFGRWPVNEANLLLEVLLEDNTVAPSGAEGRLVITSLYNKAMPFIRYDIGDTGVVERDEKGMILKVLYGRVNDTIILPSGKKSPGLTFYYISRSILESSGVLKEFIIKQTAIDHFVFEIVSDRPLSDIEIDEVKRKMTQYLEPGLTLSIRRVNKIQRPSSGKIKHFYSEIK